MEIIKNTQKYTAFKNKILQLFQKTQFPSERRLPH